MTSPAGAEPFRVHTQGAVTPGEAAYAAKRVNAVLRYTRHPVLFAQVNLNRVADPAVTRPAIVQVQLDVNGRMVRAHVARPTMREAVDEVHDRLRDRMLRARDWEMVRGGRPSDQPHEWRHTSVTAERPPYFPRPRGQRQIISHKAFGVPRMTVDEAAFEMEMLDYSFVMFAEDGSGVDSMLCRREATGRYELEQLEPHEAAVTKGSIAVTVAVQPAPRLTIAEAVERLEDARVPFVFFQDTDTGRGNVVYHRYDGHYGVITPAN